MEKTYNKNKNVYAVGSDAANRAPVLWALCLLSNAETLKDNFLAGDFGLSILTHLPMHYEGQGNRRPRE